MIRISDEFLYLTRNLRHALFQEVLESQSAFDFSGRMDILLTEVVMPPDFTLGRKITQPSLPLPVCGLSPRWPARPH